MRIIHTITELTEFENAKLFKDLDLSQLDLEDYSFEGSKLENISFYNRTKPKQRKTLKNINFKNTVLNNVSFDNSDIEDCDFDGAGSILSRVSFRNCIFHKCRFRETTFSWCDFRYCEINSATFEEAKFDFCDFYRAFFLGIIIFRKAQISNCSLFYTYFDESVLIRKDNLKDGRIIQEDREAYLKFLKEWNILGTGIRKSDQNRISNWSPDKSIIARYEDAEDIYKTLNGLWQSKGFLSDSNWAFVKGKRMERLNMYKKLRFVEKNIFKKSELLLLISWNYLTDIMFGYGESLIKMVVSYTIIILVFAFFYFSYPKLGIANFIIAVGYSAQSMLAMTPDEIRNISPTIDFLSLMQTSLGILITGIFGFILGNKIRNQ
jgi:hypothetical protein